MNSASWMKFSSIFSSISPNPIVNHVYFSIFPNYPIRMSLICLVGIIVSFTARKEKKGLFGLTIQFVEFS